MTKHTPTPWNVNGGMRPGIKTVYADSGSICEMTNSQAHSDAEQEANAAFIVRACNNHDELVSALENLQKVFVERAEHANGKTWTYGATANLNALKALAKAKGE